MMGKRRTDKCAKCKTKPDTVHHTLNGCPCMMGIYTLRHNKLCGAGYKFIGNGKLGAAVISQDIGRHNAADTPEEQAKVGIVGTRIGCRIWTPRCKLTDADAKKLDRFRPDIFIQHEMTNFHIYSGAEMLQGYGPRPAAPECHSPAPRTSGGITQPIRGPAHHGPHTVHPIMIGVTGTIYKELYDTMDLLGVSKAEAKRCAAVMHNIAVDIITTTKWQQERRGVG
jgi:hypothetical protein